MSIQAIKRGDILKTPKFNEPVRVVNDPHLSDGFVMLDLLGHRTNTFRGGVIFTQADLHHIEIEPTAASYQSDPKLFKLGLEARRLLLAYEYATFFVFLIFLVNPLPHKQEALSNCILPIIRIICNTYLGEHLEKRGAN